MTQHRDEGRGTESFWTDYASQTPRVIEPGDLDDSAHTGGEARAPWWGWRWARAASVLVVFSAIAWTAWHVTQAWHAT